MARKKKNEPGRRTGFQFDLIKLMGDRGFWPVAQLATFTGLSTTTIYRYIEDETILGQKIGKRWWVTIKSAKKYWGVLVDKFDPLKTADETQNEGEKPSGFGKKQP